MVTGMELWALLPLGWGVIGLAVVRMLERERSQPGAAREAERSEPLRRAA